MVAGSDRKIGVAARGWPLQRRHFFVAVFLSLCGTADGLASGAGFPAAWGGLASGGVACAVGAPLWSPPAVTAEDLPWASVWLGHFSGGRRFDDANGQTFIDWQDDKRCFPSRRNCQAWIAGLRRVYHRPEGYWTCLRLR